MNPVFHRTILSALVLLLTVPLLWSCGDVGNSAADADTHGSGAEDHTAPDHAPGEQHAAELAPAGFVAAADWCAEHSVPESQCTKCNPALIDTFRSSGDWCAGHGLPESHCRLCNPGIVFPQEELLRTQRMESAGKEIEVSLFFRPNAAVCATNDALIQFASAETATRTGITIEQVRLTEQEGIIEAPAEVVFDESRSTVITTTVPALVSRWVVSPGDVVREGDVLAILQAPEIASLEARLLSAYAAYEAQQKETVRYDELKSRRLISDSEHERHAALSEQVRAEYISLRGLLKSAGLAESDLDDIIEHRRVSNQFALKAPSDGLVVERIAKLGELLEAGRAFAMLADPSSMWIEARLTEQQLRLVEVGQSLTFTSDGSGLDRVGAKVIWVSRSLDQHTRTGTVRAAVIDRANHLQAGEFGRVNLLRKGAAEVVLVPKDAVQWEGCCNVVFVKEAADRYRPRKVDIADGIGAYYQVSGGLQAGEEVVVNGAFLLKTELKKTSIGAGCCGLEPAG